MKKALLVLSIIVLFFLDRISKILVLKKLFAGQRVFLIDLENFKFQLLFSQNKYLAFSLKVPEFLIYLLIFITIILLVYFLIKVILKNNLSLVFSLSLILLGAFSNLFDRFFHKGVIDFISISFYNFNWAIFNFADLYIVIGLGLWFIYLLKQDSV